MSRGPQQTNASLRKLLGESGYLQLEGPVKNPDAFVSIWGRGEARLWLTEYLNGDSPIIQSMDLAIVDPLTLGVRNPNLQNVNEAGEVI